MSGGAPLGRLVIDKEKKRHLLRKQSHSEPVPDSFEICESGVAHQAEKTCVGRHFFTEPWSLNLVANQVKRGPTRCSLLQ